MDGNQNHNFSGDRVRLDYFVNLYILQENLIFCYFFYIIIVSQIQWEKTMLCNAYRENMINTYVNFLEDILLN